MRVLALISNAPAKCPRIPLVHSYFDAAVTRDDQCYFVVFHKSQVSVGAVALAFDQCR